MAIAVATFLIALVLIGTERLHRTKVALLGAAIVVLFVGSQFDQEAAIEAIDFNTIGLLAGMMILVYLTQQTGIYDYIAIKAGQLSRGDPLARRPLPRRDDGGALGLPRQPDDDPARRPDHIPARRRARHRSDPADHHPGDRLEHRRHRDADRRPAEHHHRRRHRPLLQRLPRSTSRRSWWSPSRSSSPCALSRLPLAPSDRGEEPRRRAWSSTRAPRFATPRSCAAPSRSSSSPMLAFFAHQALHIEPATVALTGAAIGSAGDAEYRSRRRSRRSSGRRCSSSSRCS